MSSFKKVLSILLASSFLINYSFAQGEGNIWVIGYSPYPAVPCCVAILNFNADTVVIDKARNIVFFNPSNRASIADKDGKLLFYSDAQNIFNAAHKLMQNGDKININKPYNGMNSVLIVPAAQNPESYLIFSLPDPPSNGSSDSLYYSIVDMSKNDGLGAVIEKRVTLSNDIFFSVGIRAIKHGNGQDWWLLLHQFNSDSFVKFLITKDSMKGPFYQKIGLHTSVNTNFQNQMAFSKDGSLFARIFSLGEIEVYKFDRCTGELDIWKTWKQPNISPPPVDEFKGCSFSPNNRFFYASTLYKLFQYDLEADSPGVDSFLVDLADDLWSCCYKSLFNKHELGPNGKIYISSWGG
ncbi:MAG: hypothetical protein IIA45_13775, partial [Bacteroidetes bacterium]|nr:hypothetical protein [Bacteroidota bacterium]